MARLSLLLLGITACCWSWVGTRCGQTQTISSDQQQLFQHSQHHQHPGEGPFASCSQGFQQVPCVCWVLIIPTAHLPAVGHKHLESCCPLCHHANRVKAVCTQAGIREGALSRMNILFLHITSCSPKQGSPQGCKS